ncbi:MAG: hypothetical protein CML13_17100 [Puniceicoccaceae bacterium]|nr:hypothetical protein [Puniceicoccaceae bacterium]|tara:strand:- start:17144 stop:18304 length:1161 start_codon:yes stop_codon:yes gene_type:complete
MIFPRFHKSALLWLLSLSTAWAAPSVVVLDSGERLIGELAPESTETTLVLKSAVLGELRLARAHVVSVTRQSAETQAKPEVAAKPKRAQGQGQRAQAKTDKQQPATEAKPAREVSAEPVQQPAEVELAKANEALSIMEAKLAELRELKLAETFNTVKNYKTPDSWSGSLKLGINLSQGDSRWAQSYAKGNLEIKPKQSLNYYRLSGSYTYRQTEAANGNEYKSTDKMDAEFTYRRTFWDDWFVQNALGYRADHIKGIDREAQESVGIGYRYKPSSKVNVLFGAGGGVEELDADYEDTRSGFNPLLNVFQEATWSPIKRTTLVQKFNYYINPEDSQQYNYIFSAALRLRLTDLLGFEFSYNKSFDNDVGDGNAQDDVQWRNALVVYF